MKGNEELLHVLNSLLTDELTAINQYIVHSEMCENWGYEKLHLAIQKQAIEAMHQAEWLIERILFFEGIPIVSKLNPLRQGETVAEMISNENNDKLGEVNSYNKAISHARQVEDEVTVDLLIKILKMEEKHCDWAEIQREQIDQMGLENYLSSQIASQ